MYSINDIQRGNARISAARQQARGNYNQRPNGDVLLTYVNDAGKTQRKSLTGDAARTFLDSVANNTKNGKIKPSILDGLIAEIFLPPFVYSYSSRQTGITLTRKRGDEAPEHRVLPKSREARFNGEVLNITTPVHHAAKYRAAVSSLVETHWTGARKAQAVTRETAGC